jgi:hypothetical protein
MNQVYIEKTISNLSHSKITRALHLPSAEAHTEPDTGNLVPYKEQLAFLLLSSFHNGAFSLI